MPAVAGVEPAADGAVAQPVALIASPSAPLGQASFQADVLQLRWRIDPLAY